MSNQKPVLPFWPLLLLALAFALNLHALAADSLWGDEIFTAGFASRSLPEIIRWTANDIHPPLYYLIAGTFTHLTVPLGLTTNPSQVSDWLWRFPSVIAVVLTVAITYKLAFYILGVRGHAATAAQASRITNHAPRATAIAAALLLALAPIAVKYGQEARMHALFMCLSALSTLLLFRALAQPQRWSRWLAFALATTANLYTMYFGFLILAVQAGLVGFWILDFRFWINDLHLSGPESPTSRANVSEQQGKRLQTTISPSSLLPFFPSPIFRFTAAVLLAFLLYLPWWPVLFSILRKRAVVGAIEGGVGSPLTFMIGVVRALGPMPTPVAWGFLGLFIVGLIFLARKCWPVAGFAALWLILPAALPIVLGDPRALQFRYAFILPIYLTVVAYAIVSLGAVLTRLTDHNPTPSNNPASSPRPLSPSPHLPLYLTWLLATLSFIAVLGVYNQTKPNWRGAAAYLDTQVKPADIILVGPLWDEGRFIEYYYRGKAQLLTPAALVTNIQGYAKSLRANGGRVWAINRFAPAESAATKNIAFSGVVITEPTLPVYEPELLTGAAIGLASQAVEAAYPWAAEAEAQGVLNPDPRTAQAAALRAWGDSLVATGRPKEALTLYQTAVDIFPGWVNGFIVLAETQEAVGNLPAAAEAYRQAVAFNLEWHGPSADKAAELVETGQWAAAIEAYHQITEN